MITTTPTTSHGSRTGWFGLLLAVLGSFLFLFVLIPLVHMVASVSGSELVEAAGDRDVMDSIKVTLLSAAFATVGVVLGGIPLAYLLARKRFFGRSLLLGLVDLPIIIPHSAAGIALLLVIGRRSLLARVLGTGLTDTIAGVSVAMAFVSMPFLVNAAREAFAGVPVRLERVARTLGASPARVFFTISLPLAWRGIVSGMILMWGRGISEFGAVVIVAYHPMTTPVLIFRRFESYGLTSARAVAALLVLICITIFVVVRLLCRRPSPER